jgi:hypothetical protein
VSNDPENPGGSIAFQHKKATEAAEELRKRGFVPLFTGEPRSEAAVIARNLRSPREEVAPIDPGLFSGRVSSFLSAIGRTDLLVEARTRISRTGSLTAYWTPAWVSALVAPLEAENPSVVALLFERLEHDAERRLAIQASYSLGGRRAVEDIVKQFVEEEFKRHLAATTSVLLERNKT